MAAPAAAGGPPKASLPGSQAGACAANQTQAGGDKCHVYKLPFGSILEILRRNMFPPLFWRMFFLLSLYYKREYIIWFFITERKVLCRRGCMLFSFLSPERRNCYWAAGYLRFRDKRHPGSASNIISVHNCNTLRHPAALTASFLQASDPDCHARYPEVSFPE